MLTLNLLLALATSSLAQSTTTTSSLTTTTPHPTLNTSQTALTGLFFFNSTAPSQLQGFTASLLCADPNNTTFVLGCATTSPAGNTICATDRQIKITATARPTNYDLVYSVYSNGGTGFVTQSCDFGGPSDAATEAVCSESGHVAARGRTVTIIDTVTTVEVTSGAAPTWEIPVETGLVVQSEACSATQGVFPTRTPSASVVPGQSQGSMQANSAPRGVVEEVYKVLIPAGAAALVYAI